MEVGSRRAWLQYGEFIATADSNIEFITAGGDRIDLIGARIGKSAAKGPGAQRREIRTSRRHTLLATVSVASVDDRWSRTSFPQR
jgi:hypothetical protein